MIAKCLWTPRIDEQILCIDLAGGRDELVALCSDYGGPNCNTDDSQSVFHHEKEAHGFRAPVWNILPFIFPKHIKQHKGEYTGLGFQEPPAAVMKAYAQITAPLFLALSCRLGRAGLIGKLTTDVRTLCCFSL